MILHYWYLCLELADAPLTSFGFWVKAGRPNSLSALGKLRLARPSLMQSAAEIAGQINPPSHSGDIDLGAGRCFGNPDPGWTSSLGLTHLYEDQQG